MGSLLASVLFAFSCRFTSSLTLPQRQKRHSFFNTQRHRLSLNLEKGDGQLFSLGDKSALRRDFVASMFASSSLINIATGSFSASAEELSTKSTSEAKITDEIFIEFKGLSSPSDGNVDRITIGLFGNDAPQPVSVLKQVVTKEGYKSKCKPLDTTRTLQKEQLEANKVYNSCLENEEKVGVNYEYSTVWRVIKDERIDVGAVSGKFIARENPTFIDGESRLFHDQAGVVSVRRGNVSGYGFTIFPGGPLSSSLDQDNIVVGRVIKGMDVVERLNAMPVVKSVGATFSGGSKAKNAPSRGCRYGGSELYCSEDKPLKKVLLDKTGLL